jgi:DNA polymerase-3 subunit delta'
MDNNPTQPIDLIAAHQSLWNTLKPMLAEKRIPQALLLVGPTHTLKLQFVNRFVRAVLCQKNQIEPCESCSSCHLLAQGHHPDVMLVRPEGQDKGIKIDQIRGLQLEIFQTPKCGKHRFVVIEPVDRLNVFAANALLKILEEPPSHCVFILLAEQISSLLPTILSRCQRYIFESSPITDYKSLGDYYDGNSSRHTLLQQHELILTKLCELAEEKMSPCTLAAEWAGFPAEDVLWLLYLLTAQALQISLKLNPVHSWGVSLQRWSSLLNTVVLFRQLDKINVLVRKITHNINMNSTLALEDLLLGYTRNANDQRRT